MNEQQSAYYCSRAWGLKKEAVHKRSGGICERCKRNKGNAVHHKTYTRLYDERLEDLIYLCWGCHDFEHGKSDHDPAVIELKPVRVYLAGRVVKDKRDFNAIEYEEDKKWSKKYKEKILSPEEWVEHVAPMIDCWRDDIFDCTDAHGGVQDELDRIAGRFAYGGPIIEDGGGHCMASYHHSLNTESLKCIPESISGPGRWMEDGEDRNRWYNHGEDRNHSRAEFCLWQLKRCDVLFAWINCKETVGTIAEIALARAFQIPIFIAFQNDDFAKHFKFISGFSGPNALVISTTLKEAWKSFESWCEKENRSWWRREV